MVYVGYHEAHGGLEGRGPAHFLAHSFVERAAAPQPGEPVGKRQQFHLPEQHHALEGESYLFGEPARRLGALRPAAQHHQPQGLAPGADRGQQRPGRGARPVGKAAGGGQEFGIGRQG